MPQPFNDPSTDGSYLWFIAARKKQALADDLVRA